MLPALAGPAPLVIGDGQQIRPYLPQILAHPDIDQQTKNRAVAIGFRELENQWQEDIRGLNAEKRSLEAQLQRAHDQKTDLEVRVTQFGADNGVLRGQITDLGRTIAQKNQELQGINQRLATLDANLIAKQAEVTQLNERVQKAQADAAAANQQREREVKAANDRIDEVQRKAQADAAAANDRINEIQRKAQEEARAQEQRLKAVEDQNALAIAAEQKRLEQNRVDQIGAIRKKLVESKDGAWRALSSPAKRIWSLASGSICGKTRAYVHARLLIMCFDKYVQDHPGCKPDVALENAGSKAKSVKLGVELGELPNVFINGVRCLSNGDYPALT